MVVEQFPEFSQWIGPGLMLFGIVALSAILLGLVVGYIVATFRHGPFEAFYVVSQVIAQAIPDFLQTSPRRVWALARLAIKEALRRRVILVTFGIFAATLLFGGWFLNAGSEKPDQLYLNFVLWGTQMLILLMGLLISSFSLPEDIKNKTIYTVVTKPVRASEVVIGRIVGFGLLGTALLALMAAVSFFFVWRGLSHSHQIAGDSQSIASFVPVDPNTHISRITGRRVSQYAILEAETTTDSGHKHRLEVIEDIRDTDDEPPRYMDNVIEKEELPGNRIVYRRVMCDPVGGHTHLVSVVGTGTDAEISLGPSVGFFRARVPIYADQLLFYDREGKLKREGINVGKEWGYRGYVDGGSSRIRSSLSKARFDFDDFHESRFRRTDIVPLEMTLGVFRTYKGDIQKRVTGGLQFESIPDSELGNKFVSDLIDFETNEYTVQTLPIPRKLVGKIVSPDGKLIDRGEYDLFDDYGENGKLRILLSCRDLSQYIGVARGDVYFRAGDQLYWLNFVKGYLGIWCQMVIVICLGVALSSFLSTPITMLGTAVLIVVGFFTEFIRGLMAPDSFGGGPIESFIRVVTQNNMVVDLETGVFTTLVKKTDDLLEAILAGLTYLAPDFGTLDFSDFLTYGYAIDTQRVVIALVITLGFFVGLTALGYFALKTREIAK